MKKSPSKLVLRKETLRQLADKDLELAVGGRDSNLFVPQSDPKECNLVLPK